MLKDVSLLITEGSNPVDKGALWRAEEFVVEQLDGNGLDNKEPTVRAYGIESEFIGHRADLCLFDDVSSPDNSRESVARDKTVGKMGQCGGSTLRPRRFTGSCWTAPRQWRPIRTLPFQSNLRCGHRRIYDGSDIEHPEDLSVLNPPRNKSTVTLSIKRIMRN
jgi:hypothetical protein